MKTYPYTKIIMVACLGALASCATPAKTIKVPVSAHSSDSSLSGKVYAKVNAYRQEHGASVLQRHAGLDKLAQQHCEYLRKHRGSFSIYGTNVSHFGFEGRATYARERYSMESVSENVAASGSASKDQPASLVSLWAGSKGHNQNMLNSWTYTGVATVVDDDGTVFSTQLFSTVTNSQLTMHRRFAGF